MDSSVELPSGTVSFVFTDIEGSTRLLRGLGDRYAEVLERHREILRSVWREFGGVEMGTEGDSFFVAFADADSAVAGCVRGQEALAEETWPEVGEVRVRMGIHSGLAHPRGRDYVALAVHQATRVMGVAHGGQVIVTDDVVSLLTPRPDVQIVHLGPYRVRDFDQPVVLHQVCGSGSPLIERPPRATPAGGHNIVPPPTPLVGRTAELRAMGDAVEAGRVVTVCGPGGVGKTRLMVELGTTAAGRWPDGVWLVRLEAVETPDLIPSAVADALGTAPVPDAGVWSEVLDHLWGRSALLLIDNCEHLHDASGRYVAELLESCPTVAVVATSRAPLGAPAETVIRLGPLVEVGESGLPAAVELFRQRMEILGRDPDGDFDPSSVVDLCERLDGLPLAIELAAARAAIMSPSEIVTALDQQRPVLSVNDSTRPERQRSLIALLDWSHDLLDPATQEALGRLSLFAASFDLAAAAAAGGVSDEIEMADIVWSLVSNSLVVTETRDGASRYRLLRTVRDHAGLLLGESARLDAASRLADHYLGRVGPDRQLDRSWVGEMALDLDNVRPLANEGSPLPQRVRQRLAWSIGRYHDLIDAYAPGVDELSRYIEILPLASPERVAMLTLLADLHLRRGEQTHAKEVLSTAREIAEDVGSPDWDDAGLLRTAGEIALRSDDLAGARTLAEGSLGPDLSTRGRARMWNLLGLTLVELEDLDGALAAFESELADWTELGLETYAVTTLNNLAEVSLRLGRTEAAARFQLAALDLALVLGQTVLVAFSAIVAAHLAGDGGEWDRAVELQVAADRILEDSGYTMYESDRAAREELLATAESHLVDGLEPALERGSRLGLDEAVAVTRELLSART